MSEKLYIYTRSSVVEEFLLKHIGSWSCTCYYLAWRVGREQSRAQQREWQPPGGLLSALLCVRHEAVPQQIDKALFEESGEGKISQPMGELWWQLRPEHSFLIEFSWHAASNVFSPRTARKIKVVLISSNMKKKEEALPCHSIALLAYGKKEFLLIPHKKNHVCFSFWIQNPYTRKGNETCRSSVGAHTEFLILPRNASHRARPIQSGVDVVCSDVVLSEFGNAVGLLQ